MPIRISHHSFLAIIAAIAALTVFALHQYPLFAKEPAKPDILLIITDQMRGDCLSILNHAAVETPQLDKLAQQGVLFRRAYATVPSCIAARYALLTGLYPQTSGVVGFEAKPITTRPLPELLAKAGYATVLVGRHMHQAPESGACGYQQSIYGSTYVSNDDYDTFLKRAAPQAVDIRTLVEKLGLTYNYWQAKPWPLADELHPTEWTVAQSRKMIQAFDAKQPLFLTTSFFAPHPPLFPPKKYFDANAKQKLPSIAKGDWVDWTALSEKGDLRKHRVLLKGEALHTAQIGYYGLIEHVDNQISQLMRDFKNRSEKAGRSWVIVFTSDHGEMLGDHGYFRKGEPYEGSANIPLIISGSSELGLKSGLQVMQPVCLEDIMPTLLAFAEAQCPAYVNGVNLLPSLLGQKQLIRDWLHIEHAPAYSRDQGSHALTDGRFKYIWRPIDGREQLFDLETDPLEERDLSKNKTYQAKMDLWRTRLAKRLANRPEGFSKNAKLIPGRRYRHLNSGTL